MVSAGALPGRRLDLRVKKAGPLPLGSVTRDMDTEREEEKARRKEYPLAVSIKDGQYQRWP